MLKISWMFVVANLLLASCGAKQIPLNDKEILFTKNMGSRIHADVALQYDYDAVLYETKTGNFLLIVTQDERGKICDLDSLLLKKESDSLAHIVLPAIRFKENHNRFTILYKAERTTGNSMRILCSHVYSAPLDKGVGEFVTCTTCL